MWRNLMQTKYSQGSFTAGNEEAIFLPKLSVNDVNCRIFGRRQSFLGLKITADYGTPAWVGWGLFEKQKQNVKCQQAAVIFWRIIQT